MCVRIFQQDHTFFSHILTEQTSTSYLDPDRQNTSEQSGIANHISYDSTLESNTWFRGAIPTPLPHPLFPLSTFLFFLNVLTLRPNQTHRLAMDPHAALEQ